MARHIKIFHPTLIPIQPKKVEKNQKECKEKKIDQRKENENYSFLKMTDEEQSSSHILIKNKEQHRKQESKQTNEEDEKLDKGQGKEGRPGMEKKSLRQRREKVIQERPIIRKQMEHEINMRKQAEMAEDIENEEREDQEEQDWLFAQALNEQELSLNSPITSLEQLLLPRKSTDCEQER